MVVVKMIFGIPKFNLRFETLPKPFSEENNFWKVGTIFGIPNFMEIFQKLFSSENWFGEVWKFKGIFGIADKSLEDSKSIFGIPNFIEIFQKLLSSENCFGKVSNLFYNFWKISTWSWRRTSIAIPIESLLEGL